MNRRSLNALVSVATIALAIVATDARQEQKPEVKNWDVADPTGPTTALAFDTDEGTWMNVDVSPDGTQIAFDLLGDIYLMPIGGSSTPARRLTSGPAFDMQPRFSPDGKRIAMASDRDGLWNIWTVDVASKDGKDGKQISREQRWFVNSPPRSLVKAMRLPSGLKRGCMSKAGPVVSRVAGAAAVDPATGIT